MRYKNLSKRIDKSFFEALEQEGMIYCSPRCWVTFTGHDIRTPRWRANWYKQLARGQVIITHQRLIAVVGQYKIIDVPKNHSLFQELQLNCTNPKRFEIVCNLEKFQTGFNGIIQLSYWLNPQAILPLLTK